MKTIFDFSDYRAYIEYVIAGQTVARGQRSRMAEIAGCQPAYFSQVLAGRANMTSDQASKLADYWQLDELEAEYFLTLIELEKAASPSLGRRLKTKLQKMRGKFREAYTTYQQPSVKEQDAAEIYYSSWVFSAIHVLLSVTSLQKVSNLANHLGMPEAELLTYLHSMREHGLVQTAPNDLKEWHPSQKNLHAVSGSLYSTLHHRNWRMRAIERISPMKPGNLHYTAVYSLSENDFLKIRELLLSSIDDTRSVIEPSREEASACLLIDWFKV